MPVPLAQSFIQTLAWFDLFDYPLTAEELYRWLWLVPIQASGNPRASLPYLTYCQALEEERVAGALGYQDGFYFMPGRADSVGKRQRKIPLIEAKLKIARRAAKKIRWIPFARAVFVANTVAAGTADADSDIDVLIVVKHGRLYLTRLLVTLSLQVWRLRRTKQNIADRICLCFYLTDESLDLSSIRLGEPDIYLAYWLTQLIPLYDPHHLERELTRQNGWISAYLPHAGNDFILLRRSRVDDTRPSAGWKKFFETAWRGRYGDLLEAQAKAAQLAKMKMNLTSLQNEPDSRVVINDRMLKFHENDRREEYRRKWQERYREVSVSVKNNDL